MVINDGDSTAIFMDTAHCHCKRFAVFLWFGFFQYWCPRAPAYGDVWHTVGEGNLSGEMSRNC